MLPFNNDSKRRKAVYCCADRGLRQQPFPVRSCAKKGKTGRVYRARYPAEHDDPKLMPQEPDYFQEILSIDDLSKPRRAQSAEHNKYSDVLENAGDIGIGD